MHGQEVSCCVGALARPGLPPSEAVALAVQGLVGLSSGRLGSFRNKELLHLGWAAARLGYLPGSGWLEEFADETFARCGALSPTNQAAGSRPLSSWLPPSTLSSSSQLPPAHHPTGCQA
jgi:hypothetical protein